MQGTMEDIVRGRISREPGYDGGYCMKPGIMEGIERSKVLYGLLERELLERRCVQVYTRSV